MPSLQNTCCKATDKFVNCKECRKSFHALCSNLGENEFLELETGNEFWYCTSCKAYFGLCSGAVLSDHKAVQCDKCGLTMTALSSQSLSLNLRKH